MVFGGGGGGGIIALCNFKGMAELAMVLFSFFLSFFLSGGLSMFLPGVPG